MGFGIEYGGFSLVLRHVCSSVSCPGSLKIKQRKHFTILRIFLSLKSSRKQLNLYFSALSRMFFLSVPASRPLGWTFLPVTVFLSHRLISHSCIVGKTIKCLHMVLRPAQLCREAHAGNSERTGRRDATIQTYGEIKKKCGFVTFNMTNKNHEHMHER